MILVLSEGCPIFRPEAEVYLQSLLSTIMIKRHHILARPAPDRLRALLPGHLWNLYGEVLNQSTKQAANSYQRWVHAADCSTCDAAKLAHFCELPTALIVENKGTDGEWIKLIARKLRPRLAHQMEGRYISLEIMNAGGIGVIPSELERVAQSHRNARPAETLPLRVVALADSDAIIPGHPSTAAREVIRVAGRCGAEAYVLLKRTIENYVPDSALYAYVTRHPDARAAVQFVTSLTGPARDHYPLRKGLSQAEIDATGSMYPAGTSVDLKVGNLINDFLEKIGLSVEAHELKERDGVKELDRILDLLEDNL